MKFLCLLYYDTAAFAAMTPAQQADLGRQCAVHDGVLDATGQVRATGSLSAPETWHHFVPRDGQPELHAGPYLDGPRQAGAFLIVEAASDEDARRVASKHAAANVGEHLGFAVEVRRCDMFREGAPGEVGLGQVALTVSDVPKATAFYRDVIGLRHLFDAGPQLAFLLAGNVRVMLSTPQGHGTPGANSVLYFTVGNVESAHAAMLAKGAVNERAPQLAAKMPDHELWIGFVRDPDGNLVGLMEERR